MSDDDVWECPKCGAPNRPGNGRCWSCGKQEVVSASQYATPEEKYNELRRLTLEQIKKVHPDTNGNTEANNRATKKWVKQLEVFDNAFAKFQKRNE